MRVTVTSVVVTARTIARITKIMLVCLFIMLVTYTYIYKYLYVPMVGILIYFLRISRTMIGESIRKSVDRRFFIPLVVVTCIIVLVFVYYTSNNCQAGIVHDPHRDFFAIGCWWPPNIGFHYGIDPSGVAYRT